MIDAGIKGVCYDVYSKKSSPETKKRRAGCVCVCVCVSVNVVMCYSKVDPKEKTFFSKTV